MSPPRLKFKLKRRGDTLTFMILEQTEELLDLRNRGHRISFMASNGWRVSVCSCPEIRVGDRLIYLRGDEVHRNELEVRVVPDSGGHTWQSDDDIDRNRTLYCISRIDLSQVQAAIIQALIEFVTSWDEWRDEYKIEFSVHNDVYTL